MDQIEVAVVGTAALVALEPDFADDRRIRRDPVAAFLGQFRLMAVEFVDHESIPLCGERISDVEQRLKREHDHGSGH